MGVIHCDCPFCGVPLQLETVQSVEVLPDLSSCERTRIVSITRETPEARQIRIIESIEPYIHDGLKLDQLEWILVEEFHLCRVHVRPMVEHIQEAYGLYCPDGHCLRYVS